MLYNGAQGTDTILNTGTISAETSLRMFLDTGNDSLTVTGTTGDAAVLNSTTDEVRIDLGAGDGAAETVALTHTLISAGTDVVIWDRNAGTTDIDLSSSTIIAGNLVNLELSDGVGTLDLVNSTITAGNYVELDGRGGDDTYTFDLNSVVSTTVSGDVNVTMGQGDGATDTVNNDGLFTAVQDVRIHDQGAGKTILNVTANGRIIAGRDLDIRTSDGEGRIAFTDATLDAGDDIVLLTASGRDFVTFLRGSATAVDTITIDTGEQDVTGTDDRDQVRIELATWDATTIDIDLGEDDDMLWLLDPVAFDGIASIEGETGDDRIEIVRLDAQSTGDSLLIDGGVGSDDIFVQTWGSATGAAGAKDYIIDVSDSGTENDGADTMQIDGTSEADIFLSRGNFAALMHGTEDQIRDNTGDRPQTVERINYDTSINGRLTLFGHDGDDVFISDDNATMMTIDGGKGDDQFQFGQIFGNKPSNEFFADNGIAAGDDIDALLTTRGWLSKGIRFATNAKGGDGADTFTVYSNKAKLKLEGEDGNDVFIVRAFVLQGDGSGTADNLVEVRGGNGDDNIQYNVNAPVDIDGGAGFDRVIVLGTEADDNFVITSEGVFGAGLNISVSGAEESIEIDGLEGDDHFFILSTSAFAITSVIGGLGSDTFTIAGDVTERIISSDIDGRSGLINHQGVSVDDAYDGVFIAGLGTTIADPNKGQVVISNDTGTTPGELTVDEAGGTDVYTVVLAAAPTAAVYVTVSAGRASLQDRDLAVPSISGTPGLSISGQTITRTSGSWITDGFADHHSITLGGTTDLDNDGTYRITSVTATTITIEGVFGGGDEVLAADVTATGGIADSVRVSSNGTDFTDALVLTFDASNWNVAQTVTVEAAQDAAEEGQRLVQISHGVKSADANFNQAQVENAEVTVLDDDKPELLITQTGTDTYVHEGVSGSQITDTYDIRLTRQPNPGEVVSVTLNDDSNSSDLTYSKRVLSFDASNWDQAQTVTVTAKADGIVENNEKVRITHSVTTSGGIYDATTESFLDLTVSDGDSAGVIVRESNGDTLIIDQAGETDTYTMRLTKAPTQNVVINIADDGQTRVVAGGRVVLKELALFSGSLQFIHNADGPDYIVRTDGGDFRTDGFAIGQNFDVTGTADNNGAYAIGAVTQGGTRIELAGGMTVVSETGTATLDTTVAQVTFTTANWAQAVTITLEADPNFVPDSLSYVTKVFATEPHTTSKIAGPLVIDGGPTTGREIKNAVMLPTERDSGPLDITIIIDETQQTDRVFIHNDTSVAVDSGFMRNIVDVNGISRTLVNGLGMGTGTLTFNEGTPDAPDFKTYDRGISFQQIEVTEVLLGQGNDQFTVDGSNATADGVTAPAITLIHGGGGSDRITINDVTADTLFVVYGDTDTDGARYNWEGGAVNGNGLSFDAVNGGVGYDPNDFADIIDASNVQNAGLTIYGGVGDDTIIGSQAGDHIAGGSGNDRIDGQGGNDHIYGDAGFRVEVLSRELIVDNSVNMTPEFDSADTRAPGADSIEGGTGADIILADYGYIYQLAGTLRMGTTGNVTRVESRTFDFGGNDTVAGNEGADIVMGGKGNDRIDVGADANIAFGDHGYVDFSGAYAVEVGGLAVTIGGEDFLFGGSAADILMGGAGVDRVTGGNGTNILIGDYARITGTAGVTPTAGLPIALATILGTDVTAGGDDVLTGGSGYDIVMGGRGSDRILTDGDGSNSDVGDIVAGDYARLVFRTDIATDTHPILISAETTDESVGGVDEITTGAGGDIVLGGAQQDTIQLGEGDNIAIGDAGILIGSATLNPLSGAAPIRLERAESRRTDLAGNDIITAGAGADIVIMGSGDDAFTTVNSNGAYKGDIIAGDNAVLIMREASIGGVYILASAATFDDSIGGSDVIVTASGADVLIGGAGSDDISAGNGDNIVLGDTGTLTGSVAQTIGGGAAPISLVQVRTSDVARAGSDTIFTGTGADIIVGGSNSDEVVSTAGTNIVVGDNAILDFRALTSNGRYILSSIATVDADKGGADIIQTGAGSDIVIGGANVDEMDIGAGDNIAIGDNGVLTGSLTDLVYTGSASIALVEARSTDFTIGGADQIITGDGRDIVIGGADGDRISTGYSAADSADIVLGDEGRIQVRAQQADGVYIVTLMQSLAATTGGGDVISTFGGSDLVIGGVGGDEIHLGEGDNIALADAGALVGEATGIPGAGNAPIRLTLAVSDQLASGGSDYVTAGDGADIVIGGADADVLSLYSTLEGDASNIVLADAGLLRFRELGADGRYILTEAVSRGTVGAGNDSVLTGDSADLIIGGLGEDNISAGGGDNVIVGDNGRAIGNSGVVAAGAVPIALQMVSSTDGSLGAKDFISTGAGADIVIGGMGDDYIEVHGNSTADLGDLVIGDAGTVSLRTTDGVGGWAVRSASVTSNGLGGADLIYVGAGDDLVIAGTGVDLINTGTGADIILGDEGQFIAASDAGPRVGQGNMMGAGRAILGGAVDTDNVFMADSTERLVDRRDVDFVFIDQTLTDYVDDLPAGLVRVVSNVAAAGTATPLVARTMARLSEALPPVEPAMGATAFAEIGLQSRSSFGAMDLGVSRDLLRLTPEVEATRLDALSDAICDADEGLMATCGLEGADVIGGLSGETIIKRGPLAHITLDTREDGAVPAYVFNEETGRFEATDAPVQPITAGAEVALEFFDSDGTLFAYVDDMGGLWIVGGEDAPRADAAPTAETPVVDDADWLIEDTMGGVALVAAGVTVASQRKERSKR